jgi:outer membrane lipoprotein SlyB
MNKSVPIIAVCGALVLAGCASADTTQDSPPKASTKPKRDAEILTGSRLPRRASTDQPVRVIERDDYDEQHRSLGNKLGTGSN